MKENKPLKIIKDNNKDINAQDQQILTLLHSKIDKKNINIPNDESIKLLLQNEDVKNLIKYTLNKHSEIERDIEIRKKINFYYVNNKKIDEYIKLRNIQNEKKKKLEELQKKLKTIKNQRNNYIAKNEELINEINAENKKDKLSRIKLKILNNSSSSLIMDIQNAYKKYSYLNGYKYSHLYQKKKIGEAIENESEEKENENENIQNDNFNKVTNNNNIDNNNIIKDEKENNNVIDDNNKKEEQVSFINISNDISNINDSKINQIINLPKLTEEEIMKYTKYSQKLFFEKTINELKSIKTSMSSSSKEKEKNEEQKNKSIISITSTNSNNNKLQKSKEIIAVENKAKQKIKNKDEEQNYINFFSEISQNFKKDIQNEEFNVSKNYTNKMLEEKNDITYSHTLDELKNIQKENKNKINAQIWQKIVDITKVKLIKDINDKYLNIKDKNNINNLNNADSNLNIVKIKEVVIPKCVIEKNPQDTLNFYRNVINTYKKYKLRTDNFTNKRLFPSLLQLDEKYTDFMTCLINEYDYFVKLNFENMKDDSNSYSLKKFKYNINLLRKNGIKSKYDLFGFYISNIYMKNIIFENDKIMKEFNKGKAIEIYLKTIKKNDDIKKSIGKYIKNTSFNEDLNLYYDKNELSVIHEYIKEFLNIKFIEYLSPFNP